MAETTQNAANGSDMNGQRSAEEIRQAIEAEKELIAETVDRLGVRVQESLDWQEYLRKYPLLGLGAAAGLGFLVSRLVFRRASPVDRLVEELREMGLGRREPSFLKVTLLGLLSKAAVNMVANATLAPKSRNGSENSTEPDVDANDESVPESKQQ